MGEDQWTSSSTTVYEKKPGRPPKSRRKQPHEVQGKNGPKMSRHGTIITCGWCKEQNHNSAGCALKKAGIKPGHVLNNQVVVDHLEDEPVITQDVGLPQAGVQQLGETMLSQMLDEASNIGHISQDIGPLPDCTFISQNQPVLRPVQVTTASKVGKATLTRKRKAPAKKKTDGPARKKIVIAYSISLLRIFCTCQSLFF